MKILQLCLQKNKLLNNHLQQNRLPVRKYVGRLTSSLLVEALNGRGNPLP